MPITGKLANETFDESCCTAAAFWIHCTQATGAMLDRRRQIGEHRIADSQLQ